MTVLNTCIQQEKCFDVMIVYYIAAGIIQSYLIIYYYLSTLMMSRVYVL